MTVYCARSCKIFKWRRPMSSRLRNVGLKQKALQSLLIASFQLIFTAVTRNLAAKDLNLQRNKLVDIFKDSEEFISTVSLKNYRCILHS
jgi:hypothetical protein